MSDHLPPHPDEARLRRGEEQLARTIKDLVRQASTALEQHDRHRSVVLLAQLKQTAQAGRHAMAKATQDQMDQVTDPDR